MLIFNNSVITEELQVQIQNSKENLWGGALFDFTTESQSS